MRKKNGKTENGIVENFFENTRKPIHRIIKKITDIFILNPFF